MDKDDLVERAREWKGVPIEGGAGYLIQELAAALSRSRDEALEEAARAVAAEFEETNGQTVANFILKQIAAQGEGKP